MNVASSKAVRLFMLDVLALSTMFAIVVAVFLAKLVIDWLVLPGA